VYVYTNLRVLNQNVTFTNEAATEWYKQSVVSEGSDSEGPADLSNDYDNVSNFDTLDVSIDNENNQRQLEEQDGLQLQVRESEKMGGIPRLGCTKCQQTAN
jgi:hypothetical protein